MMNDQIINNLKKECSWIDERHPIFDYTVQSSGHRYAIALAGYTVDPLNDDDPFYHYSFAHNKYQLGQDKYRINTHGISCWKEYERRLIASFGASQTTPIYMCDHSHIILSLTDFGDAFDSGMIGFAFTDYGKEIDLSVLEKELRKYQDYLNGEVYCFMHADENGDAVEVCDYFYGSDFERNGLMDFLPEILHEPLKAFSSYGH